MYYRLRVDDFDVIIGEFTSENVLAQTTPRLVAQLDNTLRFEIARNNKILIAVHNLTESRMRFRMYNGMERLNSASHDIPGYIYGTYAGDRMCRFNTDYDATVDVVLPPNCEPGSIYPFPHYLNDVDDEIYSDQITPQTSAGVKVAQGLIAVKLSFMYRTSFSPQNELTPVSCCCTKPYTDSKTSITRVSADDLASAVTLHAATVSEFGHATAFSHNTDTVVQQQTRMQALEDRMTVIENKLAVCRCTSVVTSKPADSTLGTYCL